MRLLTGSGQGSSRTARPRMHHGRRTAISLLRLRCSIRAFRSHFWPRFSCSRVPTTYSNWSPLSTGIYYIPCLFGLETDRKYYPLLWTEDFLCVRIGGIVFPVLTSRACALGGAAEAASPPSSCSRRKITSLELTNASYLTLCDLKASLHHGPRSQPT
jgi:hypothetical protein